jgi:hypothetical protein
MIWFLRGRLRDGRRRVLVWGASVIVIVVVVVVVVVNVMVMVISMRIMTMTFTLKMEDIVKVNHRVGLKKKPGFKDSDE